MENTAFRVYCSTFMLFDVTLPNTLKQSHAHESDHLQSLFQYPTWPFHITIFHKYNCFDIQKAHLNKIGFEDNPLHRRVKRTQAVTHPRIGSPPKPILVIRLAFADNQN